jgi:GST-like protein
VDKPFVVFGARTSGSVPVEAALMLAGAQYEVVEAAVWEGDDERAKVAGVNPLGQIPALVLPSGEVLTESAAILMWIAEAFPEARLAPPPGDPMRAAYLRWMVYVPAAIYALYWIRDDPYRVVADEAGKALILERTLERIAECWRIMDAEISPGRYLLGDELSVLDLYVAVTSRWGPRRARFHRDAPRMSPVVRRVDTDPRLADFWSRRFPFEGVYAA